MQDVFQCHVVQYCSFFPTDGTHFGRTSDTTQIRDMYLDSSESYLFNATVVTQAFVCCSTYRSPHAEGMQPDSTSVYPPTRTSRDPRGASSAYSKPAQGQSRSSPLAWSGLEMWRKSKKKFVIAVFFLLRMNTCIPTSFLYSLEITNLFKFRMSFATH